MYIRNIKYLYISCYYFMVNKYCTYLYLILSIKILIYRYLLAVFYVYKIYVFSCIKST